MYPWRSSWAISMTSEQTTPIVIVGAGGFGREVAEILDDRADVPVLGFIDQNPSLHGQTLVRKQVLGDLSWLQRYPKDKPLAIIFAFGDPNVAHKLALRFQPLQYEFANAISPQSWISPTAQLGDGIVIAQNSIVNANARIGNHTILNLATTVGHDSAIGNCCNINPGALLAGNVHVGNRAYIGQGANILQNITVGARSIVGAGAVVTRDVPEDATVVGVPAKRIK